MRRVIAALAVAGLAGPAMAETVNFRITVGTNEKNGVCYIYLPSDPNNLEGPELEISVLAENGNVNVGMSKLPSAIATPKMEETRGPVTLTFGKKAKIKSDKGSLRAGYYYKYLGWWTDSKNGLSVLSALKDGTTVSVEFEGKKYGPIQIQQSPATLKNYGYDFLTACIKRNGGKVVFLLPDPEGRPQTTVTLNSFQGPFRLSNRSAVAQVNRAAGFEIWHWAWGTMGPETRSG